MWVELRWQWYKLARWLKHKIRMFVKLLIVTFVILSLGLAGLHLYNRMPFLESFRAVVEDYQVIYQCRSHIRSIGLFLDRDALFSRGTGDPMSALDILNIDEICLAGDK